MDFRQTSAKNTSKLKRCQREGEERMEGRGRTSNAHIGRRRERGQRGWWGVFLSVDGNLRRREIEATLRAEQGRAFVGGWAAKLDLRSPHFRRRRCPFFKQRDADFWAVLARGGGGHETSRVPQF